MNIEELLTRSAHDVASDVSFPQAPDALALGALAVARRRRRRIGTVAAAVFLVGLAVMVPSFAGRESTIEPVDRPTPAPLPDAPAWADGTGTIHVGDLTVETGEPVANFALTTGGVVWTGQGRQGLTWQTPEGRTVELTEEPLRAFASDPFGSLVVWVGRDSVMTVHDLAEGRVVYQRPVPGIPIPSAGQGATAMLWVDHDEIVYEPGGGAWIISLPELTLEPVTGAWGWSLVDRGPSGSVIATSDLRDRGSGADTLTQLEFRSAGGTVRSQVPRLFREGTLSPDGRWFVTSTGYENGLRTVVLDTATGAQVPLDLPDRMREPSSDPWGWSGTDVLMVRLVEDERAPETSYQTWACRPSTGSCEQLPATARTLPW